MRGNYEKVERAPATIAECLQLVAMCRDARRRKLRGVKASAAMIDVNDLDGTREFLENVYRAWTR